MPATRYLKNAWAKKDADGSYWLFIQGGDLQAMFRLDPGEDEDSIPRRALDAWLTEQDSTNGDKKPEAPHVEFPVQTPMNQAEQHLRQIDREWNEAYPNRDIEALNRIIADDWKCIDGTGRVISKQQLLERVSANSNPFSSHEFDEFDLRMFGDTAIVTGRLSGRGRNDCGDFSVEQRYTRVYIRRAGVWRAIATQVTVVSTQ